MKFPHFFLLMMLVLTSPVAAVGLSSEQCPIISVESPVSKLDEGHPVVFTAKLNTVVPTAEFKWKISAGTITVGDGTASITVDTTGLGGVEIAATVEVLGILTTCSTVATTSVNILQTAVRCGLRFDEFGDIKVKNEEARLDNFSIELANSEPSTGYITLYAGRQSYKGEAAGRLVRAKNYLVKVRKINPARIVTIDGGYREDFVIELNIFPPGSTPPSAFPTLSPKEIEFTKPHPSLSKRKPRTNK